MGKLVRWLRIGLLVPGTLFLWSCVAPILTVPPPAAITFIPATVTDDSGTQRTVWTTQGGALDQAANAIYYVYNRRLTSGVFTTAQSDGSFVAPPMDGNQDDQILIYYRTPTGDYSDSACVLLEAGASPPLCR
jgi:hypothetical protein